MTLYSINEDVLSIMRFVRPAEYVRGAIVQRCFLPRLYSVDITIGGLGYHEYTLPHCSIEQSILEVWTSLPIYKHVFVRGDHAFEGRTKRLVA